MVFACAVIEWGNMERFGKAIGDGGMSPSLRRVGRVREIVGGTKDVHVTLVESIVDFDNYQTQN